MTPADMLRKMAEVYEEIMGIKYALDKSDFPKYVRLIKQRMEQVKSTDEFIERWKALLNSEDKFLGQYKTVGGFLNSGVFASSGSLMGNKQLGKIKTDLETLDNWVATKRNKTQKHSATNKNKDSQ